MLENDSTPIVVLITAPSLEVGKNIAIALLEKRLVACVNLIPGIQSLYIWEGKICEDTEVLLICKTLTRHFQEEIIPLVQGIHPYAVAEIIALPINAGAEDYLDWVRKVTSEINNKYLRATPQQPLTNGF